MTTTQSEKKADVTWATQTPLAIDRETLFRYLSDFTGTRNWDPQVVDAQLESAPPLNEGSEISLQFKMGFLTKELQYSVETLTPPELVVLKGSTSSYELLDSIAISPDPANPNGSLVDYSLELFYKNPTSFSKKVGQQLVNHFANKALRNLRRLPLADSGRAKPASALLDKSIIGGLYQFTRFGFMGMKKSAHPLPITAKGQIAVVTGCTSGIGKEIATELARAQVEIVMVNRTEHKAKALAKELEARFDAKTHSYITDMSDIKATTDCAARIAKDFPTIDILINNAGELFNERTETEEGLEHNFAVLLLAPFVMIEGLLPSLRASQSNKGPARVVNMCSGGLYTQGLHLEDLQYEQGEFNGAKAYARAKRGLLDITEHYSRAQNKDNIVFHALHPGWVHTPGVEKSLAGFYNVTKRVLRTPFQGADTAIWLALSQSAGQSSGLFWLDRRPHTTAVFPGTKTHPSQQSELFARLDILQKQVLGLGATESESQTDLSSELPDRSTGNSVASG